jgi:hypothetical protein
MRHWPGVIWAVCGTISRSPPSRRARPPRGPAGPLGVPGRFDGGLHGLAAAPEPAGRGQACEHGSLHEEPFLVLPGLSPGVCDRVGRPCFPPPTDVKQGPPARRSRLDCSRAPGETHDDLYAVRPGFLPSVSHVTPAAFRATRAATSLRFRGAAHGSACRIRGSNTAIAAVVGIAGLSADTLWNLRESP